MVVLTWLSQKEKLLQVFQLIHMVLGKSVYRTYTNSVYYLSCCFDPDFIYGKEDKDGSLHICDW